MAALFKKGKSKFSRQKQQTYFLILAVLMLLITLGIVFYNIYFLANSFNAVFSLAPVPTVSQGFDIQGFQKLNLIKQSR